MQSPILFLARGHSGTSILSKILEANGVFMGDHKSLNPTYDSLPWTYDFQRKLLPMSWVYGKGCKPDRGEVMTAAPKCLARHMVGYNGGSWGIKTCAGMFSYPMWDIIFPDAKYIYLTRDGSDVILSGDGYFHLTHKDQNVRNKYRRYFEIITFGLASDRCMKDLNLNWTEEGRPALELLMRDRFLIQAKSWLEHKKVYEKINIKEKVHHIKYEDLCINPDRVLEGLFDFLDMNYRCREFVKTNIRATSVGRWKKNKIDKRAHKLMGYEA